MGFFELVLVAVGLSTDAFAASVCKGLSARKLSYRNAAIIALFFGGFQAFMPLIGWALGTYFQQHIENFDHWIAFVLLVFIGGKMIWDTCTEKDENCPTGTNKLNYKELLLLAIATSIDALAVGITFAFLQVEIVTAVILIGVTTFLLSFFGVVVGNKFGSRYEKPATIIGGIVLMVIGLKILLEGLNIIT